MFKKYGVDYPAFRDEMYFFFDNCAFHPYRWYLNPPSFHGTYFQTDKFGWRIDRSKVPEDVRKIACFGGSTMFSITAEKGSIPYHLNSILNTEHIMALNFGVGGYSSTTELISLIEVLRYETNIDYAIFYDGVNEVFRYVEYKQTATNNNSIFTCWGYPYTIILDLAMKHYLEIPGLKDIPYIPYTAKLARRLMLNALRRVMTPRQSVTDYHKEADNIANIYLANVKDITALCKARNITPIFILQPNIYTARSTMLTEREKRIRGQTFSDVNVERLTKLAYSRIASSEELKDRHFYDISDCLNDSHEDDYFLDYCHLFDNGNHIVACKISTIISGYVPPRYFK